MGSTGRQADRRHLRPESRASDAARHRASANLCALGRRRHRRRHLRDRRADPVVPTAARGRDLVRALGPAPPGAEHRRGRLRALPVRRRVPGGHPRLETRTTRVALEHLDSAQSWRRFSLASCSADLDLGLAIAHEEEDHREEAKRYYRSSEDCAPLPFVATNNLGWIHFAEGDLPRAEHRLLKARRQLEARRSEPEGGRQRPTSVLFTESDLEEAELYLHKNLAAVFLFKNDLGSAAEELKKAWEMLAEDPSRMGDHRVLFCLRGLLEFQQARQDMSGSDFGRARETLENLCADPRGRSPRNNGERKIQHEANQALIQLRSSKG